MRIFAIALAIFIVAGSGPAQAAEKLGNHSDQEATGVDCPTDGYDFVTEVVNLAIPDNDPAGILVGPIEFAPDPGAVILDVIVDKTYTHTFIGDLIMHLLYDGDCDGEPETLVRLLNRPGCDSDTDGTYRNSDEGAVATECPPMMPPACYAPDLGNDAMANLDGLPKDACYWLFVSDNAGLDTGVLTDWTVYMTSEGSVPVGETTWGAIKGTFR